MDFNTQRREVAVLVNEVLNSGSHQYRFNGEGLTSGIYFCKMKTEGFLKTMKIVLIK